MDKRFALIRRNRLPVVVAVVVLSLHAIGMALTGYQFGPVFVLTLSSALAAGLWAVRACRSEPLPSGVRWSLLAVWLVPPLLLWLLVGWEALFPSPRNPIVKDSSPYWCRVETEPTAAPELAT